MCFCFRGRGRAGSTARKRNEAVELAFGREGGGAAANDVMLTTTSNSHCLKQTSSLSAEESSSTRRSQMFILPGGELPSDAPPCVPLTVAKLLAPSLKRGLSKEQQQRSAEFDELDDVRRATDLLHRYVGREWAAIQLQTWFRQRVGKGGARGDVRREWRTIAVSPTIEEGEGEEVFDDDGGRALVPVDMGDVALAALRLSSYRRSYHLSISAPNSVRTDATVDAERPCERPSPTSACNEAGSLAQAVVAAAVAAAVGTQAVPLVTSSSLGSIHVDDRSPPRPRLHSRHDSSVFVDLPPSP